MADLSENRLSNLQDLDIALGYNSADADLVSVFYVPCLDVATRYDRAVGYFRSSVYHLVGVALSDFALRGGRMRLVCSPSLERHDLDTMLHVNLERSAASQDEVVSRRVATEIEEVLRHPENVPVVELLATLLRFDALDVRIAYRPSQTGIFHEKLGIFYSVDDQLSFTGSSNETFLAWDVEGNHEGFETFGSWDSRDSRRVARHIDYFGSLWDGRVSRLRVVPLPSVPRDLLERFVNEHGVEAAVEKARAHLRRIGRTRELPRRILQEHQTAVVDAWFKDERGIIDHVTGGGKTLSALEIMRRWLEVDDSRSVLVVVPSDLLLKQWRREIERELADLRPKLVTAGGSQPASDWREFVGPFTSRLRLGPRILLATMQTAAGEEFRRRVSGGRHFLMVADEVHRIGSPVHRRILDIEARGRLGLSATPQRAGDVDGTNAIYEYFGAVLEPHFGIPEALRAGRLVPYDYHVSVVALNEDEQTAYDRLTRQIAALLDGSGGDTPEEQREHVEHLRIRRAVIVKKAQAKVPLAVDLLRREFRPGQRWLVYCQDRDQLESVETRLGELGLESLHYHSSMVGDPPATLRTLERHGGILIAIRCLDEGVDIPSVDNALILASSTNSREYIQRRGRVLRTAADKYSADIYDVLVSSERSGKREILNRDLSRARQFAAYARNEACRYDLDRLSGAQEDTEIAFEEDGEGEPW